MEGNFPIKSTAQNDRSNESKHMETIFIMNQTHEETVDFMYFWYSFEQIQKPNVNQQ
jgi:hypothetical protein